MNLQSQRNRILDPLERFSEIVFGLVMVLSFTCAISVAQTGRTEIRTMLIGALGCNLAWGIIDAAFYLIACLTERGHNATLLRTIQQSRKVEEIRQVIADALPSKVAETFGPDDFDRIRDQLGKLPAPAGRPRLTMENWRGAFSVFLLVFLSTFPVTVPFLIFQNVQTALRVSNGVAILLLFGAGHMLARYAGLHRLFTGLAMVGIGVAFVAIAIALGG